MGKKFSGISQKLTRFRSYIQATAALLSNLHLPNFLKGEIYRGAGKTVCVPGLNCYSCPAASGACPIGALQTVAGSAKYGFSYYITGILILLGVLLGRFICGFLCPFGWFQELLHKIPSPKLSTKRLKPLRYVKYAVLLIHGGAAARTCHKRTRHGRSVLLQVPVPAGRARGRAAAGGGQLRHPCRARRTVYLESSRSADRYRVQRAVLPSVLQVAVPARRVLCAAEPRFTVPDAGGYAQMRIVRCVRQSLQNGCGHHEKPQSCRVHPLRHVHESLPDRCYLLPLRSGR